MNKSRSVWATSVMFKVMKIRNVIYETETFQEGKYDGRA